MACCYESLPLRTRDPEALPVPGREQGSLYSQQKHAISDAVEWMRTNSTHKPRIFVATTPGLIDYKTERRYVSALTHNLRNGHGMRNYVWVREMTKKGYPHFHFVADIPQIDPVKLSLYWSGLFGEDAKNSIRFGTAPGANGKRKFWIDSPRMSWYLTKYIGKAIGESEKSSRRKFRTFAISQEARQMSQPVLYNAWINKDFSNRLNRSFEIDDDHLEEMAEGLRPVAPTNINPRAFSWRWTGHGQTFVGFKKRNH